MYAHLNMYDMNDDLNNNKLLTNPKINENRRYIDKEILSILGINVKSDSFTFGKFIEMIVTSDNKFGIESNLILVLKRACDNITKYQTLEGKLSNLTSDFAEILPELFLKLG